MHQRVDKPLPESPAVIIRDWDTKKTYLDFLFLDTGFEKQLDFLEGLQQRFSEKLIDSDISAFQNLKGDFVGRQVLAQDIFAPHDEQTGNGRPANAFDSGNEA
jgi:hypothetical protein